MTAEEEPVAVRLRRYLQGRTRHGDPAADPPGTCRWRNPSDSGPWIKVADDRWVHVGGGGGQDDEAVAAWPVGTLRDPAPTDWPGRLRAAAEVVESNGHWPITAQHFDDIADRLESGLLPPHVVEAIGRALNGVQR